MEEELAQLRRELVEAEVALRVAQAEFDRAFAIREAELERNRQLESVGGEPMDVSLEPNKVDPELAERVATLKLKFEALERQLEPVPAPELVEPETEPAPSPSVTTPSHSIASRIGAKLILLCLALVALNTPIFLYSLIFDRMPGLLSGSAFLLCYLAFVALGAMAGERLLPQRGSNSLEIAFGLQFMVCFLPGLFLGAGLGSKYVKTELLSKTVLESPTLNEPEKFGGYYEIAEAYALGHYAESVVKSHSTKSGDTITRHKTTLHLAPLVGDGEAPEGVVRFWLLREGKERKFGPQSIMMNSFRGLATRDSNLLSRARTTIQEKHGLKLDEDPIILVQLTAGETDGLENRFFFWLGLLNLAVLVGTVFCLRD